MKIFFLALTLIATSASAEPIEQTVSTPSETKRSLFVRGDAAQFAGGAMVGLPLVQLNWDIAVTDRLWVGPYLGFGSGGQGRTEIGVFGWGAQTGVMLSGSLQDGGWYLRGIWNEIRFTSRTRTSTTGAHVHLLGAIFGYRWLWNSGFNLALGLGPVHVRGDTDINIKVAGTDLGSAPVGGEAWIPYPELTVGFSF